jgi:adenylate cyclase
MIAESPFPLAEIEPRLRRLLPAELYAAVWLEPTAANLMRVFQHLRTIQHTLYDYVPRHAAADLPTLGRMRYSWQTGTLLFTDLAGFTSLLEAKAIAGQRDTVGLLEVLNRYFSTMIEIISKSGGDLLEFTGDAMLVRFLAEPDGSDTAQAVRAGLRMQRAMAGFGQIETPQGAFSLKMRVGIHAGRFLTADIGTPMRMAHVLLGETVQRAKQAEGASRPGRVCLTRTAGDRLHSSFHLTPLDKEHWLVEDDLTGDRLGEYDISLDRRRPAPLLLDRSIEGLRSEIQEGVRRVEALAAYFPAPILNLLVESVAQRQIAPNFPESVVVFVNLQGLAEAVEQAPVEELDTLVTEFSSLFSLINAIAQARGGILQKVTYHAIGSDMLLYFGVMGCRTDDALRAVETAQAVRNLVRRRVPPTIQGQSITLACRVGIASGAVFAAEIGELRGRREFNILGDAVNTAARLMGRAEPDQILVTREVVQALPGKPPNAELPRIELGTIALKGKAHPVEVYALGDRSPEPSADYSPRMLGMRTPSIT